MEGRLGHNLIGGESEGGIKGEQIRFILELPVKRCFKLFRSFAELRSPPNFWLLTYIQISYLEGRRGNNFKVFFETLGAHIPLQI